jgi:hypothetical protein
MATGAKQPFSGCGGHVSLDPTATEQSLQGSGIGLLIIYDQGPPFAHGTYSTADYRQRESSAPRLQQP